MVSIVAALAEGNRAIGWRGGLPWRLPADLAHFRRLTMGHAVIMGRVTWQALPPRGLPGRRVIVLTRSDPARLEGSGVQVAQSLEHALRLAEPDPEIFIAGGASVYRQALQADWVDRMYLTLVQAEVQGDAFFPEYDLGAWSVIASRRRPADPDNPFPMQCQTLRRRGGPRAANDQESRTTDSAKRLQ